MIIWLNVDGEVQPFSEDELAEMGVELGTPAPIGGFVYSEVAFKRLPLDFGPMLIGCGVLPEQSKMVVYGSKKARKSFLALQIAHHVALGKALFALPVSKVRVLYLQFEMSLATLQDRIVEPVEGCYIGTTMKFKLDHVAGQMLLDEVLTQVRPKLLILDPFYKLLGGDVNDASQVQVVLDYIDECVIGVHKCSVVIMHHENKEGGLRGSGRLFEWPDTIARLIKHTSGNTLKFEDMRNAEEVEDIRLSFDEGSKAFVSAEVPISVQMTNLLDEGVAPEELKEIFPEVKASTRRSIVKRWRDQQQGCNGG